MAAMAWPWLHLSRCAHFPASHRPQLPLPCRKNSLPYFNQKFATRRTVRIFQWHPVSGEQVNVLRLKYSMSLCGSLLRCFD